ncbi:MAG TPA: hypothetical protein VG273_25565 [Bryobacteraceae bacterium]|nr:hypothetical protein [Bryobacteraceae bacterium]
MRNRFFFLTVSLGIASGLFAQTAGSSGGYKAPRLPDGHPDLQGVYDLATLTPVERPRGAKATLTKEEAAKLEAAARQRKVKEDAPIEADRKAPPKGGDGSQGAYGNVGGYNYGWLDPGSAYTVVDGQVRTSLVSEPDGRVPPYTPEALKRIATQRPRSTSDAAESADPGLEKSPGAYDDPERRGLGERCLLGFGGTAGPPALPDYFYNNLHQIVQTKDYVMILTEMVHDVRVVRMNSQHLPNVIRKWLGDSIGHWEGDTLVVDTTNFTDKTGFRESTENLHVIERFTRVGPRELDYRFTIEDPATWAKPWHGEYTWPATDSHIYEYACHEANYALADVLSGARMREKDEAAAKAGK